MLVKTQINIELVQCVLYKYMLSSTLGIFWINLSFINNYKKIQLLLVFLKYNVNIDSTFPKCQFFFRESIQKREEVLLLLL